VERPVRKLAPATSRDIPAGFQAWLKKPREHLQLDKPVYVVGGFAGCARFVATALRLRERRRETGATPLKVTLFQGSITDISEGDSYAVPVLLGAPLRGADGALDTVMDGAIQRHLDQRKGEAIVAVKGGRLSGDYVILETVGDI
jgi:hypothetical protein